MREPVVPFTAAGRSFECDGLRTWLADHPPEGRQKTPRLESRTTSPSRTRRIARYAMRQARLPETAGSSSRTSAPVAAPPADHLAAFVEATKALEADVVGPNVLDLLDEDKPGHVTCKALAVVGALAKEPECDAHETYFAEVAHDRATENRTSRRPPPRL
mmetsp:Transcript_29165/g.94068  ORF Transcript_29165/g.94068 Transcript_29165/m.94068 type:complete len:160 (-) Transcript_29165:847-1326(-)